MAKRLRRCALRVELITCFDIGGSLIKGAAAESAARIASLERRPTPLSDFLAFAGNIEAIADNGPAPPGSPISIAIAGVVDPSNGVIKCANIPCIDGRNLAADLALALRRPVTVANDADCFALAEADCRGRARP